MMPRCGNEKHIRGVCKRCYESTARLVRLGRADWSELEAKGHAEPLQELTTPAYQAIVQADE